MQVSVSRVAWVRATPEEPATPACAVLSLVRSTFEVVADEPTETTSRPLLDLKERRARALAKMAEEGVEPDDREHVALGAGLTRLGDLTGAAALRVDTATHLADVVAKSGLMAHRMGELQSLATQAFGAAGISQSVADSVSKIGRLTAPIPSQVIPDVAFRIPELPDLPDVGEIERRDLELLEQLVEAQAAQAEMQQAQVDLLARLFAHQAEVDAAHAAGVKAAARRERAGLWIQALSVFVGLVAAIAAVWTLALVL